MIPASEQVRCDGGEKKTEKHKQGSSAFIYVFALNSKTH